MKSARAWTFAKDERLRTRFGRYILFAGVRRVSLVSFVYLYADIQYSQR